MLRVEHQLSELQRVALHVNGSDLNSPWPFVALKLYLILIANIDQVSCESFQDICTFKLVLIPHFEQLDQGVMCSERFQMKGGSYSHTIT